MTATGVDLDAVCALADDVRRAVVGDDVTYVVNRNINFTNVCYTGCRFCAFAQRRTDADAYTLSLEQVADRAEEAWNLGATEVCMQGGIHPDLPGTAYFELARAVKARVPEMHVHAFSPMEVVNGASRTGMSYRDCCSRRRPPGWTRCPGPRPRSSTTTSAGCSPRASCRRRPGSRSSRTAHEVGLPSGATMMYGHVDNPHHWVAHLRVLARLQDETGGFTEFVPLPFVHTQRPGLPRRSGPPRAHRRGEPGGARRRPEPSMPSPGPMYAIHRRAGSPGYCHRS